MTIHDHLTVGLPPDASRPWPTRVYIVDDHPFFTFALTALVNCETDLRVCGSGAEQASVLRDIVELNPDVVVIDVQLTRQEGIGIAAGLRAVNRIVPILFVSSLQNPQFEVDSRWLEPCSFVEKTKDPADIIQGIRQTLAKFHRLQNQLPSNPRPP
jgi:DNA-binding NarL/FixJ family response regulator